ncbi:MAG: SIR2 family protein [Holosporales bacterium]|jgi:hypothetical protein
MFDKETVLILGAGASCHYGYPTGEELVERIIERTKDVEHEVDKNVAHKKRLPPPPHNQDRISCDSGLYTEYVSLLGGLKQLLESLHPLNIDSFLLYNDRYAPLAKTLIADILLGCNDPLSKRPKDYDPEKWKKDNNWYRYLFHALTYGCKVDASDTSGKPDIEDSIKNLTIITFNYDTSLERYLRKAFQSVQAFAKRADDLMRLIKEKEKIYHVYGKLADEDFYDLSPDQQKAKRSDIVRASADIEVVDIDKQEKRKNNLKKATGDALKKAQRVVILGYGFDGENNKLLDLFNVDGIKPHNKHVAYTNYGNSQRIERKFIELKKGEPRRFETSTQTVAEALRHDFDLT